MKQVLVSTLVRESSNSVSGKEKIPLDGLPLRIITHVVYSAQIEFAFPEPPDDFMGQGLAGVELHKGAFGIHL